MSDDYAKGFKDGFAAGLEEGKKLAPVVPSYPSFLGSPGYCQVCGKDFGNGKIWGYVCINANCPTRVTAYSDGAVGATYDNMSSSYPDWAGNPTIAQSDK